MGLRAAKVPPAEILAAAQVAAISGAQVVAFGGGQVVAFRRPLALNLGGAPVLHWSPLQHWMQLPLMRPKKEV